MSDLPAFEEFYSAANHGSEPFPWQRRLAARLADGGSWPAEIGIPTGLGKTSCLDIAIWWLASQAHYPPAERTAPTRIWWLVNRRLLVDATAEHATRLSDLLGGVSEGDAHQLSEANRRVLGAIGERLSRLSATPHAPPLEVVRLRGGASAARPTDPSQPAVLLSTLPMYGSRLLFRGYGSSRSMRPVDAALAGTDSLVLVDEAHLARHLMGLFEPLAACDGTPLDVLPMSRARPSVVSLTATGGDVVDRFDLDDEDRRHPVVAQRLRAAKTIQLEEHKPGSDASVPVAAAARRLLEAEDERRSCVVFTNTPATARAVYSELTSMGGSGILEADVLLLTGRARERESEATRARILDATRGAPAGRERVPRVRHLVVVATQTLEVGADLDFDLLVTEACGVRALTQRLGRLNRLGLLDQAFGSYVHIPPKPEPGEVAGWPVYGDEPLQLFERLQAAADDDIVDLRTERVAKVLGPPGDDAGRAPEMLPAHLWEWAKTSQPPVGEAPVEPFFSGLASPDYTVNIAWRAHIPGPGSPLWPRLRDEEVVDLPLREARRALSDDDVHVHRVRDDRASVEPVDVGQLRPGDFLILASDTGFLDRFGWAPEARAPVADVSVLRQGLPLDPEAIRRIAGIDPGSTLSMIVEPPDDDDVSVEEHAAKLIELLAGASPIGMDPSEWAEFLAGLSRSPELPANEVPRLRRGTPVDPLVDELDELCLSRESAVGLEAHGAGVGARARAVADRMGITADLVSVVARAARFHDVGKVDPRFQQWLDPRGEAAQPVAKSRRPRSKWSGDRMAAGWPAGGRHEAISGRLVEAWISEMRVELDHQDASDLLLHLVVSHHGWGRPLVLPVQDEGSEVVSGVLEGREVRVSAELSAVDWLQPRRFNRLCNRYGHWGLALLEAVVRQSDHSVSAGGWAGETEVV